MQRSKILKKCISIILAVLMILVLIFLYSIHIRRQLDAESILISSLHHQNDDMVISALLDGADPNSPGTNENRTDLTHLLIQMFRKHNHGGTEETIFSGYIFSALQSHKNEKVSTSLKVTEALLDSDADPNVTNSLLTTPLMLAVEGNRNDIAQALIKFKAEIDKRDVYGKNALDYAASVGNVEAIAYLCSKSQNLILAGPFHDNSLDYAVAYNQLQSVERLLDTGIDVNQIDDSGLSILDLALYVHNDAIVKALKLRGARTRLNIISQSKLSKKL